MGTMERPFPAWTWLRAPPKCSGSPTENHGAAGLLPQVLFSGTQPSPQSPSAAAAEASGHTHCLRVPAGLAGVLEAGELAVPGGPTVLVNDALLRRGERRHPGAVELSPHCPGRAKPLHPRPHRLQRGSRESPDSPHSRAQLAPAAQLPHPPGQAGPSPTQLAGTSALRAAAPVHTIASVCSAPPTTTHPHTHPGRGAQRHGASLQAEQMEFINANGFQPWDGYTGGAGAHAVDQEGKGHRGLPGAPSPPSLGPGLGLPGKGSCWLRQRGGRGAAGMGAVAQVPIRLEKRGREGGPGKA